MLSLIERAELNEKESKSLEIKRIQLGDRANAIV